MAFRVGESTAFQSPWYNEETLKTNWHMLEDYLIPLSLKEPFAHPDELNDRFAFIRKNNMAKAAIEGAVWDLYAKKLNQPLSHVIGGTKKAVSSRHFDRHSKFGGRASFRNRGFCG